MRMLFLHTERVHGDGYQLAFYLQLIIMKMEKQKDWKQETGFLLNVRLALLFLGWG